MGACSAPAAHRLVCVCVVGGCHISWGFGRLPLVWNAWLSFTRASPSGPWKDLEKGVVGSQVGEAPYVYRQGQ